MSQRSVLNSGVGFWPHLDELKRVPLTLHELQHLYALTDWRVVLLDERIKRTYQEYPTVNMFKAQALPYLLNIPSERALARELAEREPLQALCGFLPGKQPTRSALGHFRRRYSELYSELMLRVLIALVLSGSEPNLMLPFVTPISATATVPKGHRLEFQLDVYRPPIEVWTTVPETGIGPPIVTAGKTWTELRREVRERESRKRQRNSHKRGLASDLGLPAEVRTRLANNQAVRLGIDKPEWMSSATRATDPLTTVGPASLRPYVACHVLVIRQHENRGQVLLSRRLAGYGKGTLMAPGGKQRPDESLQECAARELREETGMRMLESRPVSWHSTRLPGKPRVISVGVLAEEYEGKPQRLELNQNTEWQWFDLDKLPMPLFGPAHISISHYVNKTYPDLQWRDVESQVPQLQATQLSLPIIAESYI